MTFIAMLLAVVLLQLWGSGRRVQYDGWFFDWCDFLARFDLDTTLRHVLALAGPVVLALLALSLFEDVLFGLLWLAAATLLLLYSFGRGDFQALLDRYRRYLQRGDVEAASIDAARDFPPPRDVAADSVAGLRAQFGRGLLYEGYQRWFAVLFFFFLLGPGGALAYRLLHLLARRRDDPYLQRALFVADWVPARLLGATFCLTGDFVASRDELLATCGDRSRPAAAVLERIAVAAVNAPDSDDPARLAMVLSQWLEAMRALLSRSAAAWLLIISLLVILF